MRHVRPAFSCAHVRAAPIDAPPRAMTGIAGICTGWPAPCSATGAGPRIVRAAVWLKAIDHHDQGFQEREKTVGCVCAASDDSTVRRADLRVVRASEAVEEGTEA